MRTKIRVPQWVPTVVLVLLVPVIGYLVVSNIESTRSEQDVGAQNDSEAQMIAFLQLHYGSKYPRFGYQWIIQKRGDQHDMVCYCDKKGYGWWYDVQITSAGSFTATNVADTHVGNGASVPSSLLP